MKTRKITAILLLVSLLMTMLVSCNTASTPEESDTTTAAETTTAPAESTTAELTVNLPEGLTFNGEKIRILCRDLDDYIQELSTEQNGDVVNDAVYTRNLAVEERLKVKLDVIPKESTLHKTAELFAKSVLAGSDEYDTMAGTQARALSQITQGIYYDLKDAKYLDLEKPWWWSDYINELRLGNGALFYLEGDINLVGLQALSCLYVNKQIFADIGGNIDDLYQTVLDRKWNYDLFLEWVTKGYNDLNGDGVRDAADRYGVVNHTSDAAHYFYPAGLRMSTRDENGLPTFNVNLETVSGYLEMLHNFYYNNTGAYLTDDTTKSQMFTQGRSLFNSSRLITAVGMRKANVEIDYGIIPRPLYGDETEYAALLHNNTTVYCVPKTLPDGRIDAVSATLELMSAESYKTVSPAYFEVALKAKYVSDSTTGKILDLIRAGAMTDFAYGFASSMGSVGTIANKMMEKSTFNFASHWASTEPAAKAGLEKIVAAYTANN